MATEDIGLADPQALVIANAAKDAYDYLGSPEGELAFAQACVYLATAPKSNAVYLAFKNATAAAKEHGSLLPPKHILNAPTKLMKDEEYGRGYQYDHDQPDAFSGQDYFPEKMGRQTFYDPPDRGFEREIRKRLDYWAKLRANAKADLRSRSRVCAHRENDERIVWGVPASALLHALLLVALLFSPAAPLLRRAPDATVAVDILSPKQYQAVIVPAAIPETLAVPAPTSPDPARKPPIAPSAAPAMIRPSKMLSEETLADPRSRQARQALATFADSERVVQLCNLEAMDQIHAWRNDFPAEQLVAYARSDTRTAGDTIVAEGAAFRSRNSWYDLKFKCEVAPDHSKVVAFEFLVGDRVPRDKWDELGLPAGRDMD